MLSLLQLVRASHIIFKSNIKTNTNNKICHCFFYAARKVNFHQELRWSHRENRTLDINIVHNVICAFVCSVWFYSFGFSSLFALVIGLNRCYVAAVCRLAVSFFLSFFCFVSFSLVCYQHKPTKFIGRIFFFRCTFCISNWVIALPRTYGWCDERWSTSFTSCRMNSCKNVNRDTKIVIDFYICPMFIWSASFGRSICRMSRAFWFSFDGIDRHMLNGSKECRN